MYNVLRGRVSDENAVKLLGYTASQLRARIESTWLLGMNWGNRRKRAWYINYIKPISAFVAEGVADPKIINALDNLQATWIAGRKKIKPHKIILGAMSPEDWIRENLQKKGETIKAKNDSEVFIDTPVLVVLDYDQAKALGMLKIRKQAMAASRNILRRVLDGKISDSMAIALLGYTPVQLRARIESTWQPGMDWSNHGRAGWHIHHIRPVMQFAYLGVIDPKIVNALDNLRAVWKHQHRFAHRRRSSVVPALALRSISAPAPDELSTDYWYAPSFSGAEIFKEMINGNN